MHGNKKEVKQILSLKLEYISSAGNVQSLFQKISALHITSASFSWLNQIHACIPVSKQIIPLYIISTPQIMKCSFIQINHSFYRLFCIK